MRRLCIIELSIIYYFLIINHFISWLISDNWWILNLSFNLNFYLITNITSNLFHYSGLLLVVSMIFNTVFYYFLLACSFIFLFHLSASATILLICLCLYFPLLFFILLLTCVYSLIIPYMSMLRISLNVGHFRLRKNTFKIEFPSN